MKKVIQDINHNKGFFGRNTATLAGEFLHFHQELKSLKKHYKFLTLEQIRWYVVPLVAIFETFYKELFAGYINTNESYLNRASSVVKKYNLKVSVDDLMGIAKQNYSIGELFAYSIKYNSFREIRTNYEAICQCDYIEKIRDCDRLISGNPSEIDRVKSVVSEIFKGLDRAFFLRHKIVHEYPANDSIIEYDEMVKLLDYAWLLLMITDRMFWVDTKKENPLSLIKPRLSKGT